MKKVPGLCLESATPNEANVYNFVRRRIIRELSVLGVFPDTHQSKNAFEAEKETGVGLTASPVFPLARSSVTRRAAFQ